MRQCIKERRTAFIKGDLDLVQLKKKELRSILKKNRRKYKGKVERQLCSTNAREAWNGLNVMMGREGKKQEAPLNKDVSFKMT